MPEEIVDEVIADIETVEEVAALDEVIDDEEVSDIPVEVTLGEAPDVPGIAEVLAD